MAWWNKIVSAAKSAVNKAKAAVKKVVTTIKKKISKTIKKVSSSVKKVKKTIKKRVKNKVKKVKTSVKKIASSAKELISKVVNKVDDEVASIHNGIIDRLWIGENEIKIKIETIKETIKEKAVQALEKAKEKIEVLGWRERLLDVVKSAFKIKLPFLSTPRFDLINSVYTLVTGKVLTEAESAKLKLKALDWIIPLNALSVLFLGKNLDGKPEEFGTTQHYVDLLLGLAIIVPAAKVGTVAAKLGTKAIAGKGLIGFTKLATTKIDDAAKLMRFLNVDRQTKLIGKLAKTDEGIKIINKLIHAKAIKKTLVKPTISIVNAAIKRRILEGAGLSRFLTRALRPKTIIWSLTGMISIIGLAYGIPFGTMWMAKEGIKEQFDIPLSDRMRSYRYDPTVELLEIIQDDIKKLREVLPIAEAQIRSVAWLWPLTKSMWETYADNIYFTIEQIEKELEILLPPELMVMPEKVEAIVRDIIDGDTIDVDLEAEDQETGKEIKLPEYRTSGHARIRIVGINAPEKSPKGEILCTGIEIFNVEKEFADKSRDALLPLNDKKVTLLIDPENRLDTYERILAVVELAGEDIGLRQINEGLACHYFREENKYVDDDLYSEETLDAKDAGTGMWAGLEEIEKEEDKIKIIITSTPDNARLFLDDVALRHNTPSDERELSDVIHLFTLGDHVLSAEKGGLSAMVDIEIEKGDNGTIHLDLEEAPFPEEPTEEEKEEEELEEEIEEEEEEEEIVIGPVKPAEIPKPYTSEQEWALKEAFDKILVLTEGKAIMSEEERDNLISSFDLYTTIQKVVLDLLWKDLTYYTQGTAQLSADEYIALKEKYRLI